MKQFTLRQFQTDPTKCLKSGVFEVTRYGKPLFIAGKPEEITQHFTKQFGQITQHFDKDTQEAIDLVTNKKQITQHVEQFSQEKARECDIQFCRHEAIEEADWYEYDMNVGHRKQRLWLCEEHLAKAMKDAEAWATQ